MAVDKNKIIAEATKLVQKGAYDKAIAAYQRILAEDPKEVRSLLKVAELFQKKGDDRSAAQAFEKVAETYAEQGFFLKAVAVYKQVVKIDPDDVRVNERLAGLYQQLGLMSDAMGQLQFMATAYEKAGDGAKLTDVLKRMVELEPENIASSIKLGELYARSDQAEPALECFLRAADYLKRHSRADEYLKVAERIAALSPGDVALTRELANIYLAKGDTKRALAKLQLSFKADPKDVETLHLLAQAFRDLGQVSKTVSVYKELAHVHEEGGRSQDARAIWRKVLELAPDDEDAALACGEGADVLAPAVAAPARTPPPRPAAAPRATSPPAGPPPGALRPAAPRPGPPPGARAAVIAPPPPASACGAAGAGRDPEAPQRDRRLHEVRSPREGARPPPQGARGRPRARGGPRARAGDPPRGGQRAGGGPRGRPRGPQAARAGAGRSGPAGAGAAPRARAHPPRAARAERRGLVLRGGPARRRRRRAGAGAVPGRARRRAGPGRRRARALRRRARGRGGRGRGGRAPADQCPSPQPSPRFAGRGSSAARAPAARAGPAARGRRGGHRPRRRD